MDEQNISAQELEEFRIYKEEKAREEQRKALQSDYVDLVDGEIAAAYGQLSLLSTEMAQIKRAVFDNFRWNYPKMGRRHRMERTTPLRPLQQHLGLPPQHNLSFNPGFSGTIINPVVDRCAEECCC